MNIASDFFYKNALSNFTLQKYNTKTRNFKDFDERIKIGDERFAAKTSASCIIKGINVIFVKFKFLTNGKIGGLKMLQFFCR